MNLPALALPFGQLIVLHRKRGGWTQKDVARRLGCARAYVSQLERGKKIPIDQESVRRLARVLRLSSPESDALVESAQITIGVVRLPTDMSFPARAAVFRLLRRSVALSDRPSVARIQRDHSAQFVTEETPTK